LLDNNGFMAFPRSFLFSREGGKFRSR